MKIAGTISRHAGRPYYRLGGSAIEYMMILALVVIPIALCTPMLMRMITAYSWRVIWVVRSPFG